MASQLTATLPSAGPRLVCSPLCAARPQLHDFRLAPLVIQLQLGPKTNTKAQVAGSSDPWLVEFATDSPLEGSGFEPSVPPGDRNRIASGHGRHRKNLVYQGIAHNDFAAYQQRR